MIAVDTNVLVYAHRREASEHDDALEAIRALAASTDPWALPWPCVYEFFAVVTNPKIWKDRASTPAQAWAQLQSWFDAPNVRLLHETEDFARLLESFVKRPRVRGPVVHDARVAAICVSHGVEELLTRDRDFSLFPELVTTSPF